MRKTSFASVLSTFVLCMICWILFTWNFSTQELAAGAIVSLAVALFSARFFIHEKPFWFFNPIKLFGLIAYLFIFLWELIKANVDVALKVFGGCKNINPGITKIPVNLKSDYGRAMLANTITLTPGTITMETVEENGQTYFYVHWLNVSETDESKAADVIKGRLERAVGRVFK